jgi:hypothetical protein
VRAAELSREAGAGPHALDLRPVPADVEPQERQPLPGVERAGEVVREHDLLQRDALERRGQVLQHGAQGA